ncbi:MAG: rubrerythrin family protein, partial [Candidatus Omnitrophica bacterium]|nr:rubrerythrin family protein [Candidatus Omnitrophota bacterium]
MHEMTKQNLENAFAGESKAHMKYLIFSEKAGSQGFSNIARLFKAIAFAEKVHATNHLRALAKVSDTKENLEAAIGGETFEAGQMYPAYYNQAKEQNEPEAVKATYYALEAEKIHAQMYKEAKEEVSQEKDITLSDLYICDVCGH